MSLFQTYAATPGLDRFPANEQLRVWLTVHRKLKKRDSGYRAACRVFVAKFLGATAIIGLIWLLPTTLLRNGTIDQSTEFICSMIGIAATAVFLAWANVASFGHQRWLNDRVAKEIKDDRDVH